MNTLLLLLMLTFGDSIPANNAVHIIQDERTEILIQKNIEYNTNNKIQGYRINIYSESGNNSRNAAFAAQANFYQNFPDIKSYVSFDEPYYKVQTGNYRTRLDAARALESIKKTYPQAFIVRDNLNVKDLLGITEKTEEENLDSIVDTEELSD